MTQDQKKKADRQMKKGLGNEESLTIELQVHFGKPGYYLVSVLALVVLLIYSIGENIDGICNMINNPLVVVLVIITLVVIFLLFVSVLALGSFRAIKKNKREYFMHNIKYSL